MKKSVVLAFTVLMGVSRAPASEPAPPRFGADVEMVRLSVSVVNAQDRFVTDLGADDFVVLENGVKQKVTMFEIKDQPLSVQMLVDMSASMAPKLKATVRAASRLVESLRPQDEAEITTFSQRLNVLQPATSDRKALVSALESARPEGSTSLHNALYVTLKELRREPDDAQRRRAIVVLSDGEDTTSSVTDDQVLNLAREARVGIYTVHVSTSAQSVPPASRYLLNALARESGGDAFFVDGVAELPGVYERIAQELHSQYALGYVSTHPPLDRNWRQILILTPKRQTLRVRHRVGYYAQVGQAVPGGGSRR